MPDHIADCTAPVTQRNTTDRDATRTEVAPRRYGRCNPEEGFPTLCRLHVANTSAAAGGEGYLHRARTMRAF